LEVDESGTGMYRAMLSDHTRRRELARLRLESSRHGVELLLETDPPIAIATHRRLDAAWSEMTMRSHLEAWRSTARPQATSSHLNSQLGHDRRSDPAEVEAGEAAAEAARVAVLRVLWPIVLGDRMLDALPNKASGGCMLLLLEALTSARWADELERLWNPTVEASTAHLAEASQLDAARSRAHERTVRAIEALSALAAAAPSARLGDGDEGRGVAARAWLAWLLERAPETMTQSALIRALLSGSEVMKSHANCSKVQDAYSLRCSPQVHGASKDGIRFALSVLLTEANSVTDNPLVFPGGDVVSGGNFHGQPVSQALDFAGIALATIANISERRIEQLVNPDISGLPPFLARNPGLESGFMIPQVVAASLASENKTLAHPASVDTVPTSANREDHVSMGVTAARHAAMIARNTFLIEDTHGRARVFQQKGDSDAVQY
jgi:hypothetical protein